jgi:hypothetical protein
MAHLDASLDRDSVAVSRCANLGICILAARARPILFRLGDFFSTQKHSETSEVVHAPENVPAGPPARRLEPRITRRRQIGDSRIQARSYSELGARAARLDKKSSEHRDVIDCTPDRSPGSARRAPDPARAARPRALSHEETDASPERPTQARPPSGTRWRDCSPGDSGSLIGDRWISDGRSRISGWRSRTSGRRWLDLRLEVADLRLEVRDLRPEVARSPAAGRGSPVGGQGPPAGGGSISGWRSRISGWRSPDLRLEMARSPAGGRSTSENARANSWSNQEMPDPCFYNPVWWPQSRG